jgi:STE24 endopeptidase
MITMVQFTNLLGIFLLAFALNIGVRLILHQLNILHLRSFGDQVPVSFKDILDKKTLEKMRDYTIATSRVGSIENLISDILILVILLSSFLPWLNDRISTLNLHFVFSGIIFFFVCSMILSAVEIPFDLYRNFVIEKRFSFNTLTLKLWFSDFVKSFLISAVVMGIFLGVFLSLVFYVKSVWWICVWIFFILFQFLIMWLYPVVIAPLFNKFEPIEDENLKNRISSLAEQSGINLKGLYKMDAGKRSKHSNAYFTGIGKVKRIVLFDTLVDAHNSDEISAVLAHELGHWKKGHIKKQLIVSMILSFMILYLAYIFVTHKLLYTTFGFETISIYAGLFLLTIIAKPFAFFLSPLGCTISRHFERQADDYAYSLLGNTAPLVEALKQLAKQNLSNLHPHPAYAWFYYSHPPIVERIQRLEKIK